MTELNGYLLTKEEEWACAKLVKKLRERKVYDLDFTGAVSVKAKTEDEAIDIFWEWVCEVQDLTCDKFPTMSFCSPYFEIAECNLQE